MHEFGFVHRDIRLPNILYDKTSRNDESDPVRNGKGEFCLIDFDCSDKVNEPVKEQLTHYPEWIDVDTVFTIQHEIYLFGKFILTLEEYSQNNKNCTYQVDPKIIELANSMTINPSEQQPKITNMQMFLDELNKINIKE